MPLLPLTLLAFVGGDPATHPREPVALQATVVVGGKRYSFAGKGECRHTTKASIYEVPAVMWHTSVTATNGALERVNLTLWQPNAGGAIQLTALIQATGVSHEIATVKGGTLRGRGVGRVERKGESGTLIVEGRTAAGVTIEASVVCSRFLPPEDNG